jgi:hypothetical protein
VYNKLSLYVSTYEMVNSNEPHPNKKEDGTGSFTDEIPSRMSGRIDDALCNLGKSGQASPMNDQHSDGGGFSSSLNQDIALNKDKSHGGGLLASSHHSNEKEMGFRQVRTRRQSEDRSPNKISNRDQ